VHGADRDNTRRAMFTASLGIARQLGMQTVAEGVEDLADWNFLRQQGCDLAQGYFVARPMPAGDLRAWWVDWQVRFQAFQDEMDADPLLQTLPSVKMKLS